MMIVVDVEAEYRAHAADLVRYATVLVGPHDANDVVNEAVASTIARGSLTTVDDVRAYWFGAVARTAAGWHRSSFRRRAREQRVASRPHTVGPATPDDARRLLAPLSTQQRAVVYLTYWLDWPVDRVAASLGIGNGSVKQHLARAREHLREVLGDDRA